jgi:hypothetical protein
MIRRGLVAALAVAAGPVLAQTDGEGWRAAAFDGQVSAFVSAQVGQGQFASAVYLGLTCGQRPMVRFRAPVEGQRPNAEARAISLAFESGDDLVVLTFKASLAPIAAARAPDNWSTGTDPDRAELIAERGMDEDGDGDAIRELASVLRDAKGATLTIRGADPAFSQTLPMEGAGRALARYLDTCGRL